MGVLKDIENEIVNFFLLLCEHEEEFLKNEILEKLVKKIPFGRNPYYYIELIDNPDIRTKIRMTIGEILNEKKLLYDFQNASSNLDLFKGSYLISRLSDAIYITYEDYQREFYKLSYEFIRSYPNFMKLNDNHKFEKIVDFLYFTKGYHGNTEEYYHDRNSFLTDVLVLKKGIPVSLSVLTLLFYESLKKYFEAKNNQTLNFQIYGINLPAHFILYFDSSSFSTYFDPFNFGNKITYEDCCKFLISNGFSVDIAYFLPTSLYTIIMRMLRNLQNYYSNLPNLKKEMTVKQMIKILENLFQVET